VGLGGIGILPMLCGLEGASNAGFWAWFKNMAFQVLSDGWQRQAQLGDGDSPRRGTIAKTYRP